MAFAVATTHNATGSIRTTEPEEGETAIDLAYTTNQASCVISGSKATIRNFAEALISQPVYRIPHSPPLLSRHRVQIVWAAGYSGLAGAHCTTRALALRACQSAEGDSSRDKAALARGEMMVSSSSYRPRDAIVTFKEILIWYRKGSSNIGSGLLVTLFGFCLRYRLQVLDAAWSQHTDDGCERYLIGLAVSAVVLGFTCALAAVLGIVISQLDRSTHLMLDVFSGVLILTEVGAASASFMLMTWVHNGIAPEKPDCEEGLRNLVIVTDKLLPTIGSLFVASAVAQTVTILVNRVVKRQVPVHTDREDSGDLEKEEMHTLNPLTRSSTMDQSSSWSGAGFSCSSTQLRQSPSKAKRRSAVPSTTRLEPQVKAASSLPSSVHSPPEKAKAEAANDPSPEASTPATFIRKSSGQGPGLVHPEFSGYYDNEGFSSSQQFDSICSDSSIPSAPPMP
ncbi:hypothetical protein HPB50_012522 [Hyalomma asiaticum]|uniref:Uncharacterized protein n=1 Tax=Hyalomma asiaticum TaxID=266040 RepID=A0ACB7SPZ0_HYAAI|nr:hypothetical protein HPB50_012522 [Hyalomma asiaticum]